MTEAEGEVGIPLNRFKPPPQYFNTDRPNAVHSHPNQNTVHIRGKYLLSKDVLKFIFIWFAISVWMWSL